MDFSSPRLQSFDGRADSIRSYAETPPSKSGELCREGESASRNWEEVRSKGSVIPGEENDIDQKQQQQQQQPERKGSEPKQTAITTMEKKLGNGGDVSFFSLFKYADWKDVILMVFGTLGAIGDGLSLPAALFICSGLINTFGANTNLGLIDPSHFETEIDKYVIRFIYLAIACWIMSFLEAACWMRTGERQTGALRCKYLRAILRQNEGFFDTAGANTAEVVNSVSADTLVIQEAISEKLGFPGWRSNLGSTDLEIFSLCPQFIRKLWVPCSGFEGHPHPQCGMLGRGSEPG